MKKDDYKLDEITEEDYLRVNNITDILENNCKNLEINNKRLEKTNEDHKINIIKLEENNK